MNRNDLIEFINKFIRLFGVFSIVVFGMFLIYVVNVNSPSFITVGFIVLLFGFSTGISVAFIAIKNMIKELDANE